MGCFGSRFDKRNSNVADLNTVPLQFVGGEANKHDHCPIDKIVLEYGGNKDVAEVFKSAGLTGLDEELAKKVAQETYKAVKDNLAYLEDKFKPVDGKVQWVGGKYDSKDAIKQLNEVVSELTEKSGFTFEEKAAEEPAAEGEKKEEGAEGAGEGNEGGEEGEGEGEKKEEGAATGMEDPAPEVDLYADDKTDYKGAGNLAALLMRLSVTKPYFGDLVRYACVNWEFNYKGKKPQNLEFAAAAVEAAELSEKDVWFSGWAGAEDLLSLKELAAEKGDILFPGVIAGWGDEAAALKAHGEYNGKQSAHKVLYKIKTKVCSAVVCREFVNRLSAKVDAHELKDGVNVFTLTPVEVDVKTLEEWKAKLEALAAAAAAPKEEPKEEAKEGEAKEGDAPAEGEGEKKEEDGEKKEGE